MRLVVRRIADLASVARHLGSAVACSVRLWLTRGRAWAGAGHWGDRSEPVSWEVSRIFRSNLADPGELLMGPSRCPGLDLGLDRPTYRVELGSTQRSNKDSVEG